MVGRREMTALLVVAGLIIVGVGGIFILSLNPGGGPTNTTTDPTTTDPIPDPEANVLVSIGEDSKTFNFSELKDLAAVTGQGGYRKSTGTIVGPFTYTGVPIYTLLANVADVPAGYTLEVRSDDDYITYFTRTQVEGRFDGFTPTGEPAGIINCTLMLGYYEDGVPLPSGGPLRIVTLNEDGNLTDGHFWAKDVVNITLIDEVEPWDLELTGIDVWNMTHDEYYSLASCPHHNRVIDIGATSYSGVSLWHIVSAFDGADDDHYLFNGTLAVEGYDLVVFDEMGNNVTISSISLAYNNSIIVAGWMNETLLSAPDWPLALVTSAGVLIGNIVAMEMIFPDT